jgi:hypothetical protein
MVVVKLDVVDPAPGSLGDGGEARSVEDPATVGEGTAPVLDAPASSAFVLLDRGRQLTRTRATAQTSVGQTHRDRTMARDIIHRLRRRGPAMASLGP